MSTETQQQNCISIESTRLNTPDERPYTLHNVQVNGKTIGFLRTDGDIINEQGGYIKMQELVRVLTHVRLRSIDGIVDGD